MNLLPLVKKFTPFAVKRFLANLLRNGFVKKERLFQEMFAHVENGEVKITVPELNGHFWIDIRSHLLRRVLINREYEPQVSRLIENSLSQDFIDVGANVGFYSIHVSKHPSFQGKVVAVEPNPRAYEFLTKNITENNVSDNVISLNYAASSIEEKLVLSAVEGMEEYSTLTGNMHPGTREKSTVEYEVYAKTIDSIVSEHTLSPGLIKIDAEGAELSVLQGAKNTLAQFRPTIICEIGASTFGSDTRGISKVFKECNYSLFSIDGAPVSIESGEVSEIVARPNNV